ncbi:MAG: hypothetical protein KAS39_08185, partial [Actinomycetia bacterium]|nr:hypothetical protein [Actinomycetes bacterium]
MIPFVSAQEQGALDLPDIYIYGQDRSELPGIGERDMFLKPELRKSAYLAPVKLDDPLKVTPKDEPLLSVSGYRFEGGWGSPGGEYVLRGSHGYYEKNKLFYDVDFMGNKKFVENEDFNYKDFRAAANGGKYYRNWNWQGGAQGIISESFFNKNIWKVDGDFWADIGNLTLTPVFDLDFVHLNEVPGREYEVGIWAKKPILSHQWFEAGVIFNRLEVDSDLRHWAQVDFKYINMMFRDFSVTLDAGYRGIFGDRFIYGIRASGDLLSTGYTVYLQNRNVDADLFGINKIYPYLQIQDLYNPEAVFSTGFDLLWNFPDIVSVGFSFDYSGIRDRLILINRDINGISNLFLDN